MGLCIFSPFLEKLIVEFIYSISYHNAIDITMASMASKKKTQSRNFFVIFHKKRYNIKVKPVLCQDLEVKQK